MKAKLKNLFQVLNFRLSWLDERINHEIRFLFFVIESLLMALFYLRLGLNLQITIPYEYNYWQYVLLLFYSFLFLLTPLSSQPLIPFIPDNIMNKWVPLTRISFVVSFLIVILATVAINSKVVAWSYLMILSSQVGIVFLLFYTMKLCHNFRDITDELSFVKYRLMFQILQLSFILIYLGF
ncbi:hypothetical protein [Fulvivirga lutea]|uniref:Uncharacterized protein n=1 Tax=Fulvivirga lutea TaxID=2810512 RepID=A0A974WK64_9BACT|nr:hypothetical protein [Fulvivirga lutea]QSE98657.1 hypothetical protein JR347_06145 [Fulvivirga lutea]